MRLKLQYILCVLLFLMAGPLCRVLAERPAPETNAPAVYVAFSPSSALSGADGTGLLLTQPITAGRTIAGRYLCHSLFAPEITGGIFTPSADLKALSRALPIAGYGACVRPGVASSPLFRPADLHPEGVDYYVYSLGKILI